MATKVVQFNTAYGERKRQGFQTTGESLTQQHFAQEADIKTIIKKHDRTGIITSVARGVAHYGDYSEVHEYREALDIINSADKAFGSLPSEIRAMFNNDAGDFMEFATNPANSQKMVELGLAAAPPVKESAQPAYKGKAKPAEEADNSDE